VEEEKPESSVEKNSMEMHKEEGNVRRECSLFPCCPVLGILVLHVVPTSISPISHILNWRIRLVELG
jgi:hypothetical protein